MPRVARELARLAHDPLDLEGVVRLGVVRHVPDPPALAEVDAAGELAHDHDVDAADDLGLDGRASDERVEDLDRPQVRVQAELLADAEKALLGADALRVGRVPLRPADRPEQDRVGRPRDGERLVGQRRSRRVDGRAADERFGVGERVPEPGRDSVEHLDGLGGDLGADAVTRQDRDLVALPRLGTFLFVFDRIAAADPVRACPRRDL